MTHAELRRLVRKWQKALKIEHVDIHVDFDQEPEDPDAIAAVSVSDLYDAATIRFADGWQEREDLDHIVVHELLHVMFRDFSQAIRSVGITGALSSRETGLWWDRCHDAEEGLIDRLANRIVELSE